MNMGTRYLTNGLLLILMATGVAGDAARAGEGTTTRVSLSAEGHQGDGGSFAPKTTPDGRLIAFGSVATQLIPGDTNGHMDVFLYDQWSRRISRVSLAPGGEQANHRSAEPFFSADGRFLGFESKASNLAYGDTNNRTDVFVRDLATGSIDRVSVASDGKQGNAESLGFGASFSADGRYVAFSSFATNLVAHDRNNRRDTFVHDRQTGATARVSVNSRGRDAKGSSGPDASLSADGRYVAFSSDAFNLVDDDTNDLSDAFIYDRSSGVTTRASVASNGAEANGGCGRVGLSADARFVVFDDTASNLVPSDTNRARDVFVHDRETGHTARVSLTSAGGQSDGDSVFSFVSPDGRFVTFHSDASNLVPHDDNGRRDVFVHDRATGETTRVSVATDGKQGNDLSHAASISADGRWIVFSSYSDNLVSGDTNGVSDVFLHDRTGSDCNGAERLLTNCLLGDHNVMKARVVRADPGTEVLFKLDSDRQRTRIVSNGGKAKAKWSGVEDGMREVTAELGCGDALWTVAACGEVLCTGHERVDAACNQQGVVRATVADGSPDQPVTFLLDGERPRLRTFNGKGKAKAKWGTSGGVPSGPHEIAAELACGEEVTLGFDCL